MEKQDKVIPAPNFIKAEPRPSNAELVLIMEAYANNLNLSKRELEWQISNIAALESSILQDEGLSEREETKLLRRLAVVEKQLKDRLRKENGYEDIRAEVRAEHQPKGDRNIRKDIIRWAMEQGELSEVVLDREKGKQQTKLFHLLRLYYQRGCRPLNKPQVEALATGLNAAKPVYVNRWIGLKHDDYRHNSSPQSAREFFRAYKLLMDDFKHTDTKAFENVKNHYNQLKETYPDLTY
jgi:hypothetical protein